MGEGCLDEAHFVDDDVVDFSNEVVDGLFNGEGVIQDYNLGVIDDFNEGVIQDFSESDNDGSTDLDEEGGDTVPCASEEQSSNVGGGDTNVVSDEEENVLPPNTPTEERVVVIRRVVPPTVGMTYESWEEIDEHFKAYGKENGFGVTNTGSGYRQKDRKATDVKRNSTWRCECFGAYAGEKVKDVPDGQIATPDKPTKRRKSIGHKGVKLGVTKSKKCNCPVRLYASCNKDGIWTIKSVLLKHEGHMPSPSKTRYISMFRQEEFTPSVARRLFNDQRSGIKLSQTHRACVSERGGLSNFSLTQRDMRNRVTKDRKLRLEGGDANAMYNYLKKMKEDNDNFYYSYRVDETKRLKDVMWVDARSRVAFKDFGDVVCFDSTYITNDYHLPFANFVGVNHHGQSILLGCALLSREDAETFEWLFDRWIDCMGHAPAAMLTDQDAAMKKAMETTMPFTRHRWCLWHITKKFQKRLSCYGAYHEFEPELENAIYDSFTPEEFESRWQSIIKKYKLENDEWLQGMMNCASFGLHINIFSSM